MLDDWFVNSRREGSSFRPVACKLLGRTAPDAPRSSPAANHLLTIPIGHINMLESIVPLVYTLSCALNVGNQVTLKFYWAMITPGLLILDSPWHFVRRLEWADLQMRVLKGSWGWCEESTEPGCCSEFIKSYHLNGCMNALHTLIWGHDRLI